MAETRIAVSKDVPASSFTASSAVDNASAAAASDDWGRSDRLETEKGLDVLRTFFDRNAFCTIDRPSGKGKFLVVERGLIDKMRDHWILGKLLAGFSLARVFGRTIDELKDEEIQTVKMACEAENKAWKGRGRWDFAALGIVIAVAGGSKRELVVGLLRGMEAELWGKCRATMTKAFVSKALKEASKEERELLLLEGLLKFGESAWITSLGCKRVGLDFKSVFASGGGANLNLAVSWRSVTRRCVQDDCPIFIPLADASDPEQDLHHQDDEPRRRTSPPNSPPESGRYLDVS
ncbi:hypothetical protein CBR_g29647 [Chara braunii]|uniref:Uncharacterized protein n=1 Tax=Chara braunii TaxID=69332 RepID=A0A388LB08_CHABU|nr:hypothetical protein CBR_g29647 [Chara braunii]|eukprot:GBG79500.1 hypothetical protein CBR_g29647 [Chara braunii]